MVAGGFNAGGQQWLSRRANFFAFDERREKQIPLNPPFQKGEVKRKLPCSLFPVP